MTEARKPEQFYRLITAAADRSGLDWWLIYGVIEQESGFDPNAESGAGALGLMQLMPSTFPAWSRTSLLDPDNNVKLGCEHLAECIAMWRRESRDEAIRFGLASYNGGPGYVLAAQKLTAGDGLDGSCWANVALQLPFATCDGRHCDADQMRDYVRDIWAKYEARRIAPRPAGA